MAGEPAGGQRAPHRKRSQPAVEEEQVEGEPHPEGVDAGAARDQKSLGGRLAIEVREAEQAGTDAGRDQNRAAAQLDPGEAVESPCGQRAVDRGLSGMPFRLSPRLQTLVQRPPRQGTRLRL
jgi:hypothetical protein